MENNNAGLEAAMEADLKAQKYSYRVYMVLKSGYELCIDTELKESTAKRLSKLSLTKMQFDVEGTMHTVRLEEVAYLNITKLEDVYITEVSEPEPYNGYARPYAKKLPRSKPFPEPIDPEMEPPFDPYDEL